MYTTKFLQDLAHGPFQQTGAQMERWIADAEGILKDFTNSELNGEKYKALARRLSNDISGWLKDLSRMQDEAMKFHDDDDKFKQAKEAMSDTSPGRSPDIFLIDLMRRICELPSMPIPPTRTRARARMSYGVAYGLILTALHDIQNNPGKHFSSILRGVTAAKWSGDLATGSRPGTPTPENTTTLQKRSADASPKLNRKSKKQKKAAAGPDSDLPQPQPEQNSQASPQQIRTNDAGPAVEGEENGAGHEPAESSETTPEEDTIDSLRAQLADEKWLRQQAETQRDHYRDQRDQLSANYDEADARVKQLEGAVKTAREALDAVQKAKEALENV